MTMSATTRVGSALLAAVALVAMSATPAVAGSFSKSNWYIPQCNAYYDWSGGAFYDSIDQHTYAWTYRESSGCAAALQTSINHGAFNTTYTTSSWQTKYLNSSTSQHRYGGTGVSIGL